MCKSALVARTSRHVDRVTTYEASHGVSVLDVGVRVLGGLRGEAALGAELDAQRVEGEQAQQRPRLQLQVAWAQRLHGGQHVAAVAGQARRLLCGPKGIEPEVTRQLG